MSESRIERAIALAKTIKELGSAVILALIAAGLVYHVVTEVRPALLGVQRLEASMARHEQSNGELVRLMRLMCRSARTAAREDPNACDLVSPSAQ